MAEGITFPFQILAALGPQSKMSPLHVMGSSTHLVSPLSLSILARPDDTHLDLKHFALCIMGN